MSYGKETFRGKYKETMDSLNIIKDNYYDLDYEYQMIAKKLQQKENIIKEVREYCDFGIENWITDDGFVEEVLGDVKKILDKVDKE